MPVALLAIVVAAGEASTPGSRALIASAAESLEPAASVRIVESPEPGQPEGLRIERELGATAVVVLTWTEPAHLHALLQVHVARSDRWAVRLLAFSREDTLAQRGRMLGLAAASMFPHTPAPETPSAGESARSPPPVSLPERPPTSTPATVSAPPAPSTPALAQPDAVKSAAWRPPPLPTGVAAAARPPDAPALPRRRLGLSADAAAGVGGPAAGVGGSIEGVFAVANTVALRIAGGLRGGTIAALPGTHWVASLAGGAEWRHPISARWSLVTRADALLLRHQITRTRAGDEESLGRFVPGADLVAALDVHVASGFELLVGCGAEYSLGTTEVRDGTAHVVVATIPPLRAIAQVGFRVGF